MIRKTRKINKMRGSRTIGGGCSKKRRGAGHRGGRGKAGGHKHMWSWVVKFDPDRYGKSGFKRPLKTINKTKTINLDYLMIMQKIGGQRVSCEGREKSLLTLLKWAMKKCWARELPSH